MRFGLCGYCVCAAENQVKVAAEGGIGAIVAAMRGHAASAGVQEYGCAALRHLTVNGTWRSGGWM